MLSIAQRYLEKDSLKREVDTDKPILRYCLHDINYTILFLAAPSTENK